MIYAVHHVTRIRYAGAISLARFNLRLEPSAWPTQEVRDYSLTISPQSAEFQTLEGPYPVNVTHVAIDEPLTDLTVTSRFMAMLDSDTLPMRFEELSVSAISRLAVDLPALDRTAPANYLFASARVPILPEIALWARQWLSTDSPAISAALELAQAIQRGFAYDARATKADTPVAQAFAMRRGVCQDFAHILIAALRSVGLPAAYVSGYLRTLPPPGLPRLIGADAMHAWVMLWSGPERGWIGVDPTNGCMAGPDHIFVAMGRDYADVAPIDGVFLGASGQTLSTSVDVTPVEA